MKLRSKPHAAPAHGTAAAAPGGHSRHPSPAAARHSFRRDFSGLQQGQVVDRWLQRQPLFDRLLLWGVVLATVIGAAELVYLLAATNP